jgi:DNA repair protein RecN (Recombination protein N)
MLRYLRINNFAIIDEIEVEFQEGFNVLTGETGAGKSILIGALGLVLGAKGGGDIIRSGAEEARVEALFEIEDSRVLPDDLELEPNSPAELVISRRINLSGRSKCSINGRSATLAMIEALGNRLVTVFGQHESHVLLNPDEHIEILDRSAHLQAQRKRVERLYHITRKASDELTTLKRKLQAMEAEASENRLMVQELTKANLNVNEEQELEQERDVLKKAVQIREKAYESYQRLYSKSGSVISNLSEIKKWIQGLASLYPKMDETLQNFDGAVYQLEDVALDLRNVSENTHDDPVRLEQIEERLMSLKKLKRKYGGDIEYLMNRLQSLSAEVSLALDSEKTLKECEKRFDDAQRDFFAEAETLSQKRREAARRLEVSMKKELTDLAMSDATFSVRFKELAKEKSSAKGIENIEFFLASNPGEAERPLAKIASGGELSRVMLALKALETEDAEQQAATLVFDEVDAGIGGHTAIAVGARLSRVAKRQQTICITHLHQIAASADNHLAVRKFVKKGRTSIEATPLDREERIKELARMLGASEDSAPIREHVRNLVRENTKGS